MVFCISGTLTTMKRILFEQQLLNNGASKTKTTCTRDVTHLVCNKFDEHNPSTKVVNAKKNPKCQIVTEQWVLGKQQLVVEM
tara:strand:- start:26 stop:271 length:246 start_codon:yes stop_codon:yes gene_type:complete